MPDPPRAKCASSKQSVGDSAQRRVRNKLIVLDHAGNHLRLGLVTDIHHERLDDGSPRKKVADRDERSEPLPCLCDNCKAVLPPRIKVCPVCGPVREANSHVQHRDGELVELGSSGRSSRIVPIGERAVLELRSIAQQQGYASGWAKHKFREKFGVWPNPRIHSAATAPPSLKTKQWVRSRQIAYAKGRAAHG
jgi:hypothetical protein